MSEKAHYEIALLLAAGHKTTQIAQPLRRDSRTLGWKIKRTIVFNRIENPYRSSNPKLPDYLEKVFFAVKQGQQHAVRMKACKVRGLKIRGNENPFFWQCSLQFMFSTGSL